MLVVTRQEGETVHLQLGTESVVVKLVWIDRGRARIGFDAPAAVKILRGELMPPRVESASALAGVQGRAAHGGAAT